MSETVAYLGGEPTVQYPDAGIVPFCMEEETPAGMDRVAFPFDCTPDELCELYWRVKKWKVTWDVTVGTENYSGTQDVAQRAKGAPAYVPADLVTPADELAMCCALAWYYNNGVAGGPGTTLEVGMMGTGITKNVGARLYRPSFDMSLTFDGSSGGNPHTYLILSTKAGEAPIAGPPAKSTGNFDLIANEKTHSVGYALYEVSGSETVTVNTLKIEATEWWEYAQQSDGLAVYDPVTGDVVAGRDPFG